MDDCNLNICLNAAHCQNPLLQGWLLLGDRKAYTFPPDGLYTNQTGELSAVLVITLNL